MPPSSGLWHRVLAVSSQSLCRLAEVCRCFCRSHACESGLTASVCMCPRCLILSTSVLAGWSRSNQSRNAPRVASLFSCLFDPHSIHFASRKQPCHFMTCEYIALGTQFVLVCRICGHASDLDCCALRCVCGHHGYVRACAINTRSHLHEILHNTGCPPSDSGTDIVSIPTDCTDDPARQAGRNCFMHSCTEFSEYKPCSLGTFSTTVSLKFLPTPLPD